MTRKPAFPSAPQIFSSNIVNAPLIGRVFSSNALTGNLPENVVWDGKLSPVVDMSEYLGGFVVGSASGSLTGVGSFELFTVPDDELWWLLYMGGYVTNIDAAFHGYVQGHYVYFTDVTLVAGDTKQVYGGRLPLLGGCEIDVDLTNDLGADAYYFSWVVQRLKK